jgi:hypothetical protein
MHWQSRQVASGEVVQRLSAAREGGRYTPRHAGNTPGNEAASQPEKCKPYVVV